MTLYAGNALLKVDDLSVEFRPRGGVIRAVRGISYEVRSGETLAIVGESGCGKTVSSLALLGLVGHIGGYVSGGTIRLGNAELSSLDESGWRNVRARRIAMVFQDPQTALNPVFTVGWQIGEMFRQHLGLSRTAARQRTIEALDRVRVPDAASKARSYPHELSGGMRQRVLIAMALALDPEIIVADEPTTALDATVTSQILELFRELSAERNLGVVLVTHDVEVAAELADRVVVMYAGRIVEGGPTSTVLERPAHPYTRGLLAATPRLHAIRARLKTIPGAPPDLSEELPACAFAPRCVLVHDRCNAELPELREVAAAQRSACHVAETVLERKEEEP